MPADTNQDGYVWSRALRQWVSEVFAPGTTRASLAAAIAPDIADSPALTSQFGSVQLIRGSDGLAVSGSPAAVGANSRYAAMAFDAAADEAVSYPWIPPATWATMHVDFYWSNGAGSGDVVWFVRGDEAAADGATLNASGTLTQVTATAPAASVLEVTRVASDVVVDPTKLYSLRLGRLGTAGADTLAVDALLVAIKLTRAS